MGLKPERIAFAVRYYCPYCHAIDEIIVVAESRTKAIEKVVGTPITCTSCLRRFLLKHEYIKEAFTLKEEKMAKPVREAPTVIVSAKRYQDNTVSVTLRRAERTRSIVFPASEVQLYDTLMQIARKVGQDTYKNALLAHLIAHGATTKSLAAGFLNANNISVAADTIGEALSRMPYVYAATEPVKIQAIPRTSVTNQILAEEIFEEKPPKIEARKPKVTFMGETIYYIPETTRIHIIERIKLDPAFPWWQPEALKPIPIEKFLTKAIQYEWVKITKKLDRIRSAEDLKYYGPYKEGEMAKLPLTLAYYLVRTGYAEWLNPSKHQVRQAEEIFRFQPIEKIKKQATLTELLGA